MSRDEALPGGERQPLGSGEVRDGVRELCEDAHRNDVRVEQLVIAIKEGWISLHGDRPRSRSDGPDLLLNQVVSRCIDEYYARAAQG